MKLRKTPFIGNILHKIVQFVVVIVVFVSGAWTGREHKWVEQKMIIVGSYIVLIAYAVNGFVHTSSIAYIKVQIKRKRTDEVTCQLGFNASTQICSANMQRQQSTQ